MRRRRSLARRIVNLVLAIFVLGALLLIVVVATGTVRMYAIASSAMEPGLHCARPAAGCEAGRRDRVLALTRFVSYDRGDVVTFTPTRQATASCGGGGGTYVKRISGLPGETVRVRVVEGTTSVFVDGRELREPYVEHNRSNTAPVTLVVPDDHYFVLGDNRTRACDSRHFGAVPEENLAGVVFMTLWPPGRISFR